MRIPLSWLNDYVALDETPRQIADRLTFSGTEVEAIETLGSTYEGFVVGEVRSVEKHPNADKLSVCRVFDGQQELQVVCGAPNVQAGGKYPLARIGTTLPDGSLTIKRAKLRGVESSGMLCAADELGLSDDHAGLLTLAPTWAAGTPLAEVLGPPDVVFDLEVTPNRPDCLCLIGIARELAAVYRKPLKRPARPAAAHPPAPDGVVRVEDSSACARYTARLLENVTVGPSPDWMRRRLEAAGIRSINNVVDITNYVMLETGHPLHAFDRDLLAEGRVVVRRARPGERMATLDGADRALEPAMLVIADASRPVALAGVMGGAGSEIRAETKCVLLEAAHFDPVLVRATTRALGLSTESSYRFERGVDAAGVEEASLRAAALMTELAGATVAGFVDVYRAPAQPATVTCRYDFVRDVLGVEASNETIRDTLGALQLGIGPDRGAAFDVTVPTFRRDLEREIDLVEEFARVYGLDRIPTPAPRAVVDPQAADDGALRAQRRLRDALSGLGLGEILNYSLVAEPLLDLFDRGDREQRVPVPRPISADQSVLRNSLVPQMVETLGKNRAHQTGEAALYEIGRVFSRAGESTRLCIGLLGPVGRTGFDKRRALDAGEVFLWAKGLLEQLADALHAPGITVRSAAVPYAEPGAAVDVRAGDAPVGTLALVSRRIRQEWRISDPVAILDLDVAALTRHALERRAFQDIPAYPSVARDVAMIVADHVRHEDIVKVIREIAPPELESVEIFDIFKGGAVGPGRRSVAYSLTYRSAGRTLTDEEANGYHDSVKAALRRHLGTEIRES